MRALLVAGPIFLAATSLAGCLKNNGFNCAENGGTPSCSSPNALCEPEGFCSIPNASCASGREFDSSAGSRAGECTSGGVPTDDGVDMPVNGDADAPVDMQTGDCKTDVNYVEIVGGQTGHKYKLITTKDRWVDQLNIACNPDGAYLAIPDDATELQAIFDTDQGNNGTMWLGVSDRATEGTIVDSKGNAYNALALVGNGNNEDCATTADGVAPLVLEKCGDGGGSGTTSLIAVCECDP